MDRENKLVTKCNLFTALANDPTVADSEEFFIIHRHEGSGFFLSQKFFKRAELGFVSDATNVICFGFTA